METNIIFIADSRMADNQRISKYLRRNRIIVHPAFSTGDAYRLLRETPVSVILADYDIPKVNNLSFLRKIRSIKPYVEVIFLSAKVTLSRAIEAMKAGAYDFYESPVNTRLLLTMIDKAAEKQVIHSDKIELEQKVKEQFNYGKVVGRSKAMKSVMQIVKPVAARSVSVLLTGETGSGKEMIANLIHHNSPRASGPFIKMNCASFNEGVLESELFGHEKGAFTGAVTRRIGRFELAHDGTIFLDEIGDMPMGTQVKLLRILQERVLERVGGNEPVKVNVRIIAATNQDLRRLIEVKKFREDLFYRLNVVNIEIPPLRARKDDIPLLVCKFMQKFNEENEYQIKGITRTAMQIFLNYTWPGNVRELENAVESAMALATTDHIEAQYLPSFLLMTKPQDIDFYQVPQTLTLEEIEKEIIAQTLAKTRGNKSRAAKLLGIGLRTLQRKYIDM